MMSPTSSTTKRAIGRRLLGGSLAIAVTLTLAACGKPFNVKPKPTGGGVAADHVDNAAYNARTEAAGVSLEAQLVTDEDYLYDTFEANLVMAGMLAVRARIKNTGAESVRLKDARFEVRAANNRAFKLLSASKAFGRLIKYYGISVYNKRGYAQAKEDFLAYGLDDRKDLAAGEEREGLLFFAVPSELIKSGSLTLTARKLKVGGRRTPLELTLRK